MSDIETLIEVLRRSVRKHGSIPLTTGHLLNLLQLAQKISDVDDYGPDIGDEL